MEAVKPRGRKRGRPKKFPRRVFPEAEDINRIKAAVPRTAESFQNYIGDSNSTDHVPAYEGSSVTENNDTEQRDVKPRGRPRKGIPVRSPFY